MSEIFSREQIGMKTALIGAGIASIGTKEDIFYVDLRCYDGFSLKPKRTTIEANRKMMLKILDCLPKEHSREIRKAVVEDGNFILIDPIMVVEMPMIQGTASWSKLMQRTCIIPDEVINLDDDRALAAMRGE